MASAGEWAQQAQLEPVDWSTRQRDAFKRKFLELPQSESWEGDVRRQELGICIEDLGPLFVAPAPVRSFEELEVLPHYALENLKRHNITAPLPIQAQALPLVLGGCDVIGLAQTGSGKTLAFLLPAVAHIEAQPMVPWGNATPIALILAPTRELAVQISDEAAKVLKGSNWGSSHRKGLWSAVVYGGGRRMDQERSVKGAHIIVATPGRLIDFVSNKVVSLERVTYFVLDEADRMLDMGFQCDVDALSKQVRPERQVLFFSATWSAEVQELASGLCHEGARPVRISYGQGRDTANGVNGDAVARHAREGIVQQVVVVDYPGEWERQAEEKREVLYRHVSEVLEASEDNKVLVFVSQKGYADELANKLWEAGFKAAAMHGGKAQESRLNTLDQFRKGYFRLLVATDVIGRGIDIPDVSHVVIYEMGSIDDYIHRIGRTARGKDAKGHALVFFEYYYKEPKIAEQLAEVLVQSGQVVPDALRQIIREVETGKREVFQANGKWGGKDKWQSWTSDGGWNSANNGKRWQQDAPEQASNGKRWQQDASEQVPTTKRNEWSSSGDRRTPVRTAPATAFNDNREVPDSWEDDA